MARPKRSSAWKTPADGSVRFVAHSIDGVAVKWLVGERDAQTTPEF